MYLVSRQFHEKMRAHRRHVLARVTIDYTDPDVDQSVQVAVSEDAGAWPNQVADGITRIPHLWASLDGSWVLGADVPHRLMPETSAEALLYQVGWWGEQLADEDGYFDPPYPTLTVTYVPRPAQTLRLVGDSARGEYPVDFTIELYDEDDQLLHQEIVTGNTEVEWRKELPAPIPGAAKQVATITRWSHPGRQVKVAEFFTSVQGIYEGQALIALRLVEERETSAGMPIGSISSNELAVQLVNDGRFDPDNTESPLYGLLIPNRRIRAWLGSEINGGIEWVPLGTFWSTEWDSSSDVPEALVRARDRLERLRMTEYRISTVQQDVSAADLIEAILLDAGVAAVHWMVEPELEQVIIPWAWFPVMTHREALRLVAEAALAIVYCDRDGRIRIGASPVSLPPTEDGPWYLQGGPFPAEATVQPTAYGIGPDDYFRSSAPSRHDHVANEVVVRWRPVVPDSSPSEVYRSTPAITVPAGQTITVTVQYQDPPVMAATASLDTAPQDVAIVDARYYAWGAEVDIEHTGGSDVDVTLVITGIRLVPQPAEQVVVANESSQVRLGRLVYTYPDNHLVQTRAQAAAIAVSVLASSSDPRRDIELDWRGNPALELGDPVTIITDMLRDRRSEYVIVRQELEWAGYLRAKLTGRRVTS